MFGFQSQFMPCSECGASVQRSETDEHVCEQERRLDYQMLQLREEIDGLAWEISAYFASPQGRFELWCAERDRGEGGEPRAR